MSQRCTNSTTSANHTVNNMARFVPRQVLIPLTEILQLLPPPMLIPAIPPAAEVLDAMAAVPVAVPDITIELMDMSEWSIVDVAVCGSTSERLEELTKVEGVSA